MRSPAPWPFPWPKPKNRYCDDGPPPGGCDVEIAGHAFRMDPTNLLGVDTGRMRFRVECKTCGMLLHEATTGPSSMIRHHLIDFDNPQTEEWARRMEAYSW